MCRFLEVLLKLMGEFKKKEKKGKKREIQIEKSVLRVIQRVFRRDLTRAHAATSGTSGPDEFGSALPKLLF